MELPRQIIRKQFGNVESEWLKLLGFYSISRTVWGAEGKRSIYIALLLRMPILCAAIGKFFTVRSDPLSFYRQV